MLPVCSAYDIMAAIISTEEALHKDRRPPDAGPAKSALTVGPAVGRLLVDSFPGSLRRALHRPPGAAFCEYGGLLA